MGKATAIAMAQAGVAGLILFARSDLSGVKEACLAAKRAGRSLEVLTLLVDISKNEQVVAAVRRAEEVFGRLDIVINNAARVEDYKLLADSDPADWWATWDINVRGTYHVIHATLPFLVKCDGDKTIINVNSAGSTFVLPTLSSYSVSSSFINIDL